MAEPLSGFLGKLATATWVLFLTAAALGIDWKSTVEDTINAGKPVEAAIVLALVVATLVFVAVRSLIGFRSLGPSDVVVMLSVGVNLEHTGASVIDALPFVAAAVIVAALPLRAYLLFRGAAERAMPKVRDWMNSKSWLVNILVCVIFTALILS